MHTNIDKTHLNLYVEKILGFKVKIQIIILAYCDVNMKFDLFNKTCV